MKIDKKVCIVTGGAGGLGLGAVRQLLAKGAAVAVFDMRDDALATLGNPPDLSFQRVNVSDEEQVIAAINATVARFGAIHVCVNCAGIIETAPTVSDDGVFPAATFRRVLEVNLVGSFIVLSRAAEQMLKNPVDEANATRGVIINTSSIRAFDGGAGGMAYTASKGALTAMTISLARDMQAQAIRVNTVAPGAMDTELFRALPADVQAAHIAKLAFPKRNGSPDEFGSLICHLIENEYMNGETIRLDGALRV